MILTPNAESSRFAALLSPEGIGAASGGDLRMLPISPS